MTKSRRITTLFGASAIAGIVASLAAVSVGPAPIAVAATEEYFASVELDSLPTTTPMSLPRFSGAGPLTSVTVIATLEGSLEAFVTNLSAGPRATTISFVSAARSVGAGGIGINTTINDSTTEILPPNEPRFFALADSDEQQSVVTDPAQLAQFQGPGTVDFTVSGDVEVNVVGPANWRVRGVAEAVATVRIIYTYTDITTTTTSTTSTTSTTTTLPPTTTSTTTTLPPTTTTTTLPPTTTSTTTTTTLPTTTTTVPSTTTTTTLPPTTTTLPPTTTSTTTTTTTLPPTTTTVPSTTTTVPPTCTDTTVRGSGPSLPAGTYLGGIFTILEVDDPDNPSFVRWSSTQPVAAIWVDRNSGTPDATYDPPVTSGTVTATTNNPNDDFLTVRFCQP